jgi:hypothetical protein
VSRVLKWLAWVLLLLFFAGLFLPISSKGASDEEERRVILALARWCWYTLAVVMPWLWFRTGKVGSETGVSARKEDPLRYWLGVVTGTFLFWGTAIVMHYVLQP